MQDGQARPKSTGRARNKRQNQRPKAISTLRSPSVTQRDAERMGCGASGVAAADKQLSRPRHSRLGMIYGYLDAYKAPGHRIFRLYTNSTFEDLDAERTALASKVYPKIRVYCRERGYEFQAIDLKLSLSRKRYYSLTKLDTCVRELEKCQQLSVGPSLLVMLSERLGDRPLPHYINPADYEKIKDQVMIEDREFFHSKYKLDKNSIVPIYVLQPEQANFTRQTPSDILEESLFNTDLMAIQNRQRLKIILMMASKKAGLVSTLIPTETEVILAMQANSPEKSCLWCHRAVEVFTPMPQIAATTTMVTVATTTRKSNDYTGKYKAKPATASMHNFIDNDEEKELLDKLKREHLHRLCQKTALRFSIHWSNEHGVDPEKVKAHADYIDIFCSRVEDKLKDMVASEIESRREDNDDSKDVLLSEVSHHIGICNDVNRRAIGRLDLLKEMESYLLSTSTYPYVVYGTPGSGKTSLVSMAMKLTRRWLPGKVNPVLVVRYIGTSPYCTSLRRLLYYLCVQINEAYGHPEDSASQELNDLVRTFPKTLTRATDKRPLVIFFDSICNLETYHSSRRLSWLPIQLPPHVKIVVTTSSSDKLETLAILQEYIDDKSCFLEVPRLSESVLAEYARRWLSEQGRALTARQWNVVITACKRYPSPLYVKLATNEATRWRSFDSLQDTWLELTVKGIFNMIFERIEREYGRVLVERLLGYLAVARYGLSEIELEDILSLDDDVMNDVYLDSIPTIGRMPSLLWIRVCDELSPYLVERVIDGVLVKAWSHEQVRETAEHRYLGTQDKRRMLHSNVADYFLGVWSNGVKKPIVTRSGEFGKKDRFVALQPLQFLDGLPNNRKLNELPYHLLESDRLGTLKVKALCNYEWLSAKMTATSFSDVIEDFTMAFRKYPDDEQLRTVYETLQLSKDALRLDTTHLSSQLIGRMSRTKGLEELLKQANASLSTSMVPSLPFLSPPMSQLVHRLQGHTTTITAIDMTQDGKYIATASLDESINIWSVHHGILQASVCTDNRRIMKLKYADEDKLLLASFADKINILHGETLVAKHSIHVRGLDGKAPPLAVGGKAGRTAITVRPGKLVLLGIVSAGNVMAEIKDSILQRSSEGTKLDACEDLAVYFNPVSKKQIVKLVNLDGKPVIKSIKIPTRERAGNNGDDDNLIAEVVVTSSRSIIVIGRSFSDVTIFDSSTLRLIRRIRIKNDQIHHRAPVFRFMCEDEHLVFPMQDAIAVCDIAGDDGKWYGMQHRTDVTGVVSVDMKTFVTIATDNVVRIWDVSREDHTEIFIRNNWDSHKIMSKMDAYNKHGLASLNETPSDIVDEEDGEVLTSTDVQIDTSDQHGVKFNNQQNLLEDIQILSEGLFHTDHSIHPSERSFEVIQQIALIPGSVSYALIKSKFADQYSLTIWNLATLNPVRRCIFYRSRHRSRDTFDNVKIVPLNERIAAIVVERRIVLVDFVDGFVIRTLEGIIINDQIVLFSSRNQIGAIEENRENVIIHDAKSGEVARIRPEVHTKIWGIAAQDEGLGKVLVIQLETRDCVFEIWNVPRRCILLTLKADSDYLGIRLGEMVLTSDCRYLCMSHKNDVIMVWNLHTGQLVRRLKTEERRRRVNVYAVVGTERMVVGYDNGTIVLWSLTEGRIIHKFLGHTSALEILKPSNDGQRALSMTNCGYRDNERQLILWDLENGSKLAAFRIDYFPCNTYPKDSIHLLFNGNVVVIPGDAIGSPVSLKVLGRQFPPFEIPTQWPTPYQEIDEELLLDFSQALGQGQILVSPHENEARLDDNKDGGEE